MKLNRNLAIALFLLTTSYPGTLAAGEDIMRAEMLGSALETLLLILVQRVTSHLPSQTAPLLQHHRLLAMLQ
jgi:hypothetical protein